MTLLGHAVLRVPSARGAAALPRPPAPSRAKLATTATRTHTAPRLLYTDLALRRTQQRKRAIL